MDGSETKNEINGPSSPLSRHFVTPTTKGFLFS
jgi:hypothetical protein